MNPGMFPSLTLLLLVAVASHAAPGRFGVGMEGTPNGASPTLRIELDETTALNLSSPSLNYSSYAFSKNWNFGLAAAILPLRRAIGNIKHGPRVGVSGSFQNENPESGPARNNVNSGVNVGWDLEYFVAAIPGLSVGGNVSAGYAFSWQENPGSPSYYSHRLSTQGHNLNLRYYF